MLEHLKKYWFLLIVVIVLVVGTVVFSKQQIDSSFKGKKVNGKDIVFALDGKNINADEYYEELFPDLAGVELYRLFERYVLSEVETSDEIKEQSATYAKNQIANTSNQGVVALDQLEQAILASGYSRGLKDLPTLYENQAKLVVLERDYIKSNRKDTADHFIKDNNPRIVSHILIKMADPAKPTDAEKKKWDDAKAALEKGDAFGDVALKFSDDTGSATQKGSIGFMDKNSQLEAPFLAQALKLKEGETSEWFDGKNGKHIVLVDSTSFDKLIDNDDFVNAIAKSYPKVQTQSVYDVSKDFDVTFEDKDAEKLIKEFIEGGN